MADDLLACEAIAIQQLNASVISATDIGTHAVEYAARNWPVLPLNGKVRLSLHATEAKESSTRPPTSTP